MKQLKRIAGIATFGILLCLIAQGRVLIDSIPGVRKIKDVIIYKDSMFFSAFPSVIKKPDGELLVAFRRAPDRRIFGGSMKNTWPIV